MKIDAHSLTRCSVEKGGETISLGLLDENGEPVELNVSAADACAIAMTLPRLLKDSLKQKYQDESLRYVFPLDGWHAETASDGSHVIMTFMTGNGFEVSFSAKPAVCRSLGIALNNDLEHRLKQAVPLGN